MTEEERNALRLIFREEVNSAVYASEQRMGERIDTLTKGLDSMNERLNTGQSSVNDDHLDTGLCGMSEHIADLDSLAIPMPEHITPLDSLVMSMAEDLEVLKTDFWEMKGVLLDIKFKLVQLKSVLNEISIKINDIERSQYNLENKVEENIKGVWRDVQRMFANLQTFTKEFNAIVKNTHARLDLHENTPIGETHPGSAA